MAGLLSELGFRGRSQASALLHRLLYTMVRGFRMAEVREKIIHLDTVARVVYAKVPLPVLAGLSELSTAPRLAAGRR